MPQNLSILNTIPETQEQPESSQPTTMTTTRRVSISNHSSSTNSASRTNTPSSRPSSPMTVITAPSTRPSSPTPEEGHIESVTSTLQLIKNTIAALDTYIVKMESDRKAGRIPEIAVYEIRNAQRYQAMLRMKVDRMKLIKVRLESEIRRGQATVWDHEFWQQDLDYVSRAQKYLVGAHVFYKINYELAK